MLRRSALLSLSCLAVASAFIPAVPAPQQAGLVSRQPRAAPSTRLAVGPEPQGLIPEDDEEAPEGSTEMDGVIFEGDFEDDSVKPSLTSLLEDVGDDVGGDAFKLDSDDSFFSIPDYVPSELPDLAALGSGLESKRELMSEFVEGEFDPNDQKMYKMLGLDALDEKKTRVNPDDFTLPGAFVLAQAREAALRKYQKHGNDVGSSQVQVAQLTETVNYLTRHVQTHPRDYAARRGLIRSVNLRRKLLNFMSKKNRPAAVGLAAELGIRFRAPDEARSKFDMYRFFKNTKSKKAKNMQLVGGGKSPASS